ncbi:MAG: ATP-binding protein [Waterburya sp.]
MNLPIKYRPIRFDQVVGQSVAVEIAKASLLQSPLQTTFLFLGASGSGKTTLAKIMARSLNCNNRQGVEPCNQCDSCQAHLQDNHLAISEINGADKTGVDDVRDIIEKCQLHTLDSKYRVLIIDECHQMSKPAQNAMLKLLEDPPIDTVFLLCTTEEDKLLETIRSRARILRFQTVARDLVAGYLMNIAHHEQIPLTEAEAHRIYEYNQGSIRQCLQTLGTVSQRVTVEDLCPQIAEAKLQSLLLAFEARDYLSIDRTLQELIGDRFYPKHILSALVDYTIAMMTRTDTSRNFIVNADKILAVLIPATNKLGSGNNAQTSCRLTLYEAAIAWQPMPADHLANQVFDELNQLDRTQVPTSEQLQGQYVPAPMQPQSYQVQFPIPVQLQPEQYVHVQGNQHSVNSYPPQNGGFQNRAQANQQLSTYQNGHNNGVYQLPIQERATP